MRKLGISVTVVLAGCVFGMFADSALAAGGQGGYPVRLRIGHVGHDHQIALFVALDYAEEFARRTGISLIPLKDRKFYSLREGGREVALLEIVRVGGGAKMPTALAQGVIDVGFGGVAPVLAAVDSGLPLVLISPLHSKGDMLAVRPDFPAGNWEEFVRYLKASKDPVRIGYKAPTACAKMIMEEALARENISFTGDPSVHDADVHMINVKGGGKLNPALASGLIDAYVGNNPFPAIGKAKGMLKSVCELEELPPGTFRNHPCCCIAANRRVLESNAEVITRMLAVFLQATAKINADLDAAVATAARWIGTTEQVERASIPTSGYSMDPSKEWHRSMGAWLKAMNELAAFNGTLAGLEESRAAAKAYDLSLLRRARKGLDN